jgi:RNA polymerase sigma factor (sigma-70 family)
MDVELAQNVRLAREGDIQAFSYVVTAFQATALGWARQQTQGEHAAEDAVADAFVLAFSRMAQLREIEAFAGWLQALVRTCCLRQLRRRMTGLDEEFDAGRDDPPERELASAELREAVRGAVGELREGQRQVIERHYLAGQKLEDIARELGLPLGTVKRRLFEARENLRLKLSALGADDEWRDQP